MGNIAYVYMLCCAGGGLYTGYTTDLHRRMTAHTAGKGGHYTHAHPPTALAMVWRCDSTTGARRLEYALKHRLSAAQKRELLAAPGQVATLFPALSDYTYEPLTGLTLNQCLEEHP